MRLPRVRTRRRAQGGADSRCPHLPHRSPRFAVLYHPSKDREYRTRTRARAGVFGSRMRRVSLLATGRSSCLFDHCRLPRSLQFATPKLNRNPQSKPEAMGSERLARDLHDLGTSPQQEHHDAATHRDLGQPSLLRVDAEQRIQLASRSVWCGLSLQPRSLVGGQPKRPVSHREDRPLLNEPRSEPQSNQILASRCSLFFRSSVTQPQPGVRP